MLDAVSLSGVTARIATVYSQVTLVELAAGVALFVGYCLWVHQKRQSMLPPGPKGKFYVGPQLSTATKQRWLVYAQWAKEFGDIIYFKSYGRDTVILHSYEAARDLLNLRARIYSERPKMTMARKIVGYDNSIVLADNTPRTTFMRKSVQTELSPKNLPRFHHIQQAETHIFLGKLLNDPENFLDHIRILITYEIFTIAYGYRPKSDNDQLIQMIKKMMEDFAVFAAPGAFLVDNIPILRYLPSWVPGASFKKFGLAAAGRINAVCALPFDMVKKRMTQGEVPLSVVSTFLQMPDITPEKEHMLRWASEAVYAAGSDTTGNSVQVFVLAMARNPDAQAKAHAELDRFFALEELRIPTFEDREHLPYIDKLLWEVLRWYNVVPLGVAHRVSEDDVYEGIRIPKNATVIANLWSMCHDERYYPDAFTFNPDRFDNQIPEKNINMDPRKIMFGFGRRICAGQHLAEVSLWQAIVAMLTVYKITPITDPATGKPQLPDVSFTAGVIIKPIPFKCNFTPRNPKAEALIRTVSAAAMKALEA